MVKLSFRWLLVQSDVITCRLPLRFPRRFVSELVRFSFITYIAKSGFRWLNMHFRQSFLACLFRGKSRIIVIARSSLLSPSCKNFNIAHYSKSMKGINAKLEYLLFMTKYRCKTRGITLNAIFLELCPF